MSKRRYDLDGAEVKGGKVWEAWENETGTETDLLVLRPDGSMVWTDGAGVTSDLAYQRAKARINGYECETQISNRLEGMVEESREKAETLLRDWIK